MPTMMSQMFTHQVRLNFARDRPVGNGHQPGAEHQDGGDGLELELEKAGDRAEPGRQAHDCEGDIDRKKTSSHATTRFW
jgi:hypothetical protein